MEPIQLSQARNDGSLNQDDYRANAKRWLDLGYMLSVEATKFMGSLGIWL